MRWIRALVVWLLLGFAGCPVLFCVGFSGYTRRIWQAPDGLPEQTVQAFAQTPDGYLWIGTTGGLLRFDGAHFTLFDRQNTPALHESSIFCLMAAHDGALWIGTEGGGLARYAHGAFRSWSTHEGLSNDFVRTLLEDAHGTVWAGTDNGLLRLSGDHFVRVDSRGTLPALAVHGMYQDRSGSLWVGGSRLFRLRGNLATEYVLRGEVSQNRVKSIVQTQDGSIWVGTVSGLNRMRPGDNTFKKISGITGTVRVLRQTPDGVLWIGTIGQGAFEYHAGELKHITAPESLPSNTVLNFFEDSERNFWIGTQTGMVRLTRARIHILPLPQSNDSDFGTIGLDRDGSFWIGSSALFRMKDGKISPVTLPGMRDIHVRNIFRDRSGAMWVGTDGGGVFRIVKGQVTRLTSRDGLSNNFVRAMTQDRDGSMWVATDEGLNHILVDAVRLRVVSYQMHDGLVYFSTRVLLEDRRGDLWIGTDRGLSHIHAGHFVHDAATEAMVQMKIWAIHEDSDGGLWFGTRNSGLFRLRNGRIARYTVADGLASNAIYQILEDSAGHFWMSGPSGISLFTRRELDAQAYTAPRRLSLTFYPLSEMPANTEIYGGTQPSGCITPTGEVWFSTSRGPLHVLPGQSAPLPPPQLRIQSVFADGRATARNSQVVLQPHISRLEFVFAPIRLQSQDSLRFRYRLEGFDHAWSAPSVIRTADYTNLPSGHYRFRVQTFEISDPNAVSEASIEVIQKPALYRTWWFITACILLLALLIYAIYQYRMRQVRERLEAVLEERSRLAREMHDTVIQGCTGVSALLEALSMKPMPDKSTAELTDFARVQLRSTINEAREAIWNLRQSETHAAELCEKLEGITTQISREFRLPVAFEVTGTPFSIDPPMAHDLLMVAREAVSNAVLHGHPAQVHVALAYTQRDLQLTIEDDGSGFDLRQIEALKGAHFGLKGMKERVERSQGKFHLTAAPGQGVRVQARLPRNR